MGTYGYKGEPETCIWCGRKLVYRCETIFEDTDKWRPPTACYKCPHGDIYDTAPPAPRNTWEPAVDPENPLLKGFFLHKPCGEITQGSRVRKAVKRERIGSGGYSDQGYFCSATCGWRFAVAAAENGYRFEPKK